MNSLRGISKKINAILIIVMAGLALGLVLAWHYYQTRKLVTVEKDQYAAELLAHDLPGQAVRILEDSISRDPLSEKSLKKRKTLADIYMKELDQYEKALAELVFIRTFAPGNASETESEIRYCLNRLGRTYDVERRQMLAEGINPLKNEVASDTVIRIGNKEALSLADLKNRLQSMNLDSDNLQKSQLDKIVHSIAREKLLKRAAEREKISQSEDFVRQIREFEENLKIKLFLEKNVFSEITVKEAEVDAFIKNNADQFKMPDRVKYSCFAFQNAGQAEFFIEQKEADSAFEYAQSASAPQVIADEIERPVEKLPAEIRSLNFSLADQIGFFGPIKIDDKYLVYQIHSFVPGQKLPPAQVRNYAKQKLTERKQQEILSAAISELAEKEEMKINEEVIKNAFFAQASETQKLKNEQ
ncbi:MAG: peptidyl-prolyl cis-trans isomerase [Candidatus Rifleibacteriota bacterium]